MSENQTGDLKARISRILSNGFARIDSEEARDDSFRVQWEAAQRTISQHFAEAVQAFQDLGPAEEGRQGQCNVLAVTVAPEKLRGGDRGQKFRLSVCADYDTHRLVWETEPTGLLSKLSSELGDLDNGLVEQQLIEFAEGIMTSIGQFLHQNRIPR